MREKDLIQIKKTKSVLMAGNREEVYLSLEESGQAITIPMGKVFQVKRGLESYIQRFYRIKRTKK